MPRQRAGVPPPHNLTTSKQVAQMPRARDAGHHACSVMRQQRSPLHQIRVAQENDDALA